MSKVTSQTTGRNSHMRNLAQINDEYKSIQASYRFNGKNYLSWSQVLQTILTGKRKINHLLGTGSKPRDPKFDAWDEKNSTIMALLWNYMLLAISNTVMFLPNAKEVWDIVN